jgi:hypothetical protein
MPVVGVTVSVRSPVGGLGLLHPVVGEPLVWPYGSVQVTVVVQGAVPALSGAEGQFTVRVVGRVTNIEEKGSRALYMVPDVVDPSV